MDTEFRFVEFRDAGEGRIEGTVVRYGSFAELGGGLRERFAPGSILHSDVIANIQHERSKPVARTGAGLTLADSPAELRASIAMPDTAYGREARELVKAGILRGLSMEFLTRQESWEGSERTILSADLVGIGIVDRPAYPDSVIAERALARAGAPSGRAGVRYFV